MCIYKCTFLLAFPVAGGFLEKRQRFAATANCVLPLAQPGGWSAKGQPCDQVFGHYKARTKQRMDQLLGFNESYFKRQGFEDLPLGSSGSLS